MFLKNSLFMFVSLMLLNSMVTANSDCEKTLQSYKAGCVIKGDYGYGEAKLFEHANSSNLDNLIVYVSGFDQEGTENPDNVFANHLSQLNQLIDNKNSLMVVTWGADATQPIQDSADALITLFKDINALKNNTLNKSTIIGFSMGGLIVKYALLKAEKDGLDHGMSIYASLDSPHKGAQAPIGDQYLLFGVRNQVSDLYNDLDSSILIDDIWSDVFRDLSGNVVGTTRSTAHSIEQKYQRGLLSDSSQQMLIYNIIDPTGFKKDQLTTEINNMGGMPNKTHNIGLANGTLNDYNTGVATAHVDYTISNDYSARLIGYDVIDAVLNASYQSSSSEILGAEIASVYGDLPIKIEITGKYFKCYRKKKWGVSYPKCGWHTGTIASVTDTSHNFDVSYTSPVSFDADRWPGSRTSAIGELRSEINAAWNDAGASVTANHPATDNSTFIPTHSALDIKDFDPSSQTGFNLKGSDVLTQANVTGRSSFDEVWFSNEDNLDHSDHNILVRTELRDILRNNNDDYWLIPIVTSLL